MQTNYALCLWYKPGIFTEQQIESFQNYATRSRGVLHLPREKFNNASKIRHVSTHAINFLEFTRREILARVNFARLRDYRT